MMNVYFRSGTALPQGSGSFSVWIRTFASASLATIIGLTSVVQSANANPALVIEVRSGQVLHAEEATRPWYPASLTKMLTMYVALKAVQQGRLKMSTPLVYTARASKERPSKMGFRLGTRLSLEDAIKMLMVKSANDIAVTIAEGVSGSVESFVAEMNTTARQIGMDQSYFTNPNGWWDPQMTTTARDMALLGRALLVDFPQHSHLVSIPAIQLGKSVIRNSNNLIGRYNGAQGMKTGYTCPSGFNLVALARRGNTQLIAVVLGSSSNKDRGEWTAELLERGFEGRYGPQAGQIVNTLPYAGGTPPNLREALCSPKAREARIAQNQTETGEEGLDEAMAILSADGSTQRSLLGPRPKTVAAIPVSIEVPPPAPAQQQRKGTKRNSRAEAPLEIPFEVPASAQPVSTGASAAMPMPSIIAEPLDVPPPPQPARRQKPRPIHEPFDVSAGRR